MHPFCRSTPLAVLPSEEELDKAFEDFKADNIPEGMDFDEWLDGLEPTEDGKLVFRDKRVDKSAESGIIKLGSGNMSISSIEVPIEQRHTGKGNPNAVLMFDIELNNRQQKLLDSMPDYDSRVLVPRTSVNMADLSALTAKTGDEFAMFTKGNERLIIRGNSVKVNITPYDAIKLSEDGFRWSGHTHPGTSDNCMISSPGDHAILDCFKQKTGVIYNSKGQFRTFEKEE